MQSHSGLDENKILLEHIQKNADSFLFKHLDGLVVVCGDFNPLSTVGITEQQAIRLSTGLVQVIKVLRQDSGTLDWCLTNRPKLFSPPKQLTKIGTSDHNTVLILPRSESSEKPSSVSSQLKRDLRPSKVDAFGRWITQHDWRNLFNPRSVKDKFDFTARNPPSKIVLGNNVITDSKAIASAFNNHFSKLAVN